MLRLFLVGQGQEPGAWGITKRVLDTVVAVATVVSILLVIIHHRDEGSTLRAGYDRDVADLVLIATELEKSHLGEFSTRAGVARVVKNEVDRRENFLPKLVIAAKTLNEIAICHERWLCHVDLPNYNDIITEFWGTYRDVLLPLGKDELAGFCKALEREATRIARSTPEMHALTGPSDPQKKPPGLNSSSF